MTDREAFLGKIVEQPGEDMHRLVFADWLDEHAEAERASHLRRPGRGSSPRGPSPTPGSAASTRSRSGVGTLGRTLGRWAPSPEDRDAIAAVFGLTRDKIRWGHAAPVRHLYGQGPA